MDAGRRDAVIAVGFVMACVGLGWTTGVVAVNHFDQIGRTVQAIADVRTMEIPGVSESPAAVEQYKGVMWLDWAFRPARIDRDTMPSDMSVYVIDLATGKPVSTPSNDDQGNKWAIVSQFDLSSDATYQAVICDRSGMIAGASVPLGVDKSFTKANFVTLPDVEHPNAIHSFDKNGSPLQLKHGRVQRVPAANAHSLCA